MKPAPAANTKIFGMQLGASRGKLAILGVLVLVAIIFLVNNAINSGGQGSSPAATPPGSSAGLATELAQAPARPASLRVGRRRMARNEGDALRLRPIDARKGNIDPTLRLDLLRRLQLVPFVPSGRSLFDAGVAPVSAQELKRLAAVTIPTGPKPGPIVPAAPVMAQPPPIPLKFYGFVQPRGIPGPNRGFFLEGDNILVGAEGQILLKRYKIVQLSAHAAIMEDTTSNDRQTLPLVPEAPNAM
ncbi:MAG: hypothetical protein WA324_12495 [Bryobacteraceae bacterium]